MQSQYFKPSTTVYIRYIDKVQKKAIKVDEAFLVSSYKLSSFAATKETLSTDEKKNILGCLESFLPKSTPIKSNFMSLSQVLLLKQRAKNGDKCIVRNRKIVFCEAKIVLVCFTSEKTWLRCGKLCH